MTKEQARRELDLLTKQEQSILEKLAAVNKEIREATERDAVVDDGTEADLSRKLMEASELIRQLDEVQERLTRISAILGKSASLEL